MMNSTCHARTFASAAALVLVSGLVPAGAASIDVFPSIAPNVFGSPSWATYNSNALDSIENGLGTTGDPTTDPTGYETRTTFFSNEIMVSSFNSWLGEANPAAPFSAEKGNRLHFGAHILGEGVQFTLGDITFDLDSTDSGDVLDFSGDFVGSTFNDFRIGIDYVDGVKGNGDDVVYDGSNTGSDSTLVDEFIYVGVGNAFWPMVPDDGATEQEALDNVRDFIDAEAVFTVTTTYTVAGLGSGAATASIHAVPAPAPFALLALGLAGIGFVRRR